MRAVALKSVTAAAAAAFLSLTGCIHYTLRPDRPLTMPKAGAPPLPLKVGLAVEEDQPRSGKEGGFGARFAEALRQSRLFQDVRYPLALSRGAVSGVDLVIGGRFSAKFVQDPMQGPKIVFVVFTGLITGAILSETSHHLAQGEFSVMGPDGRELKSYSESVDVVAKSMVSMFAEMSTGEKGPPAAMENLVSKLVQGLIDDRPFFERLGAPAQAAPQRPVKETVTGGEGQPWWQEDSKMEPADPRAGSAPDETAAPKQAPKPKPSDAADSQFMP